MRWEKYILLFFPLLFLTGTAQNAILVREVKVGVVLDMDTQVGKIWWSCLSMAVSDFYASHDNYKTKIVLHPRDSKNDVIIAAAAALELINNDEVQAIIGPASSMQARFVIDLGVKAHVPILSFSATSPSLSPVRNPYFFRATQNDSSQVEAISSIIHYYGWREAVPIYVENEYGEGIIPYLTDALQRVGARVPYRSVIAPNATDDQIADELYKLMTMQTRVFIVHMWWPALGFRVFAKATEIGMMADSYVWIATDGIGNFFSTMNSSTLHSMQGVLGIRTYVPSSKSLEEFRVGWKRKFQIENPDIVNAELDIFGLRGYDAAVVLAMAVEKVGITNDDFSFQRGNISNSSNDLESIRASQVGPALQGALSSISFRGLAGHCCLVNGQLPTSTVQIVNVIGNALKRIGYWTTENELTRELKFNKTSNDSKPNLRIVIWPGEPVAVPRGWVVSTNEKKLKIAVPVKFGFKEFVDVVRDPNSTNEQVSAHGYCIDVFEAVMQAMPYQVSYEYVSFNGSYNDLTYQVFLQKYDAAVGDVTIVANRSNYVDFTLPYVESGVTMIVPMEDDQRDNAWIFLKPITWELWMTSACFFAFIGFVVWVLEHRVNEDFRGPPSHQVGTIFWFSFSTRVFAQKEKVSSNLARFLVTIWIFVVLILIQSYTASLTSMLTVEKLRPTITDVKELIKRGSYVGYQKGTFVEGILREMKVDEKKLRSYESAEECDVYLSKGSKNGGIDAAFDEIPYMRVFLATRCSKYTMVGPSYKTAGFGFVFRKDSLLVSDVSRAILNVTQGDKMTEIENKWFIQNTCPDTSTSVASIGLNSFWGLFLIAGVASFLAFLVYAIMFIYEHKHVIVQSGPEVSIWRKIEALWRIFDHKDLDSHTFRKSAVFDQSMNKCLNCSHSAEASPNSNLDVSPTSYSIHTDFSFYGKQGRRSVKYGETNPISQTGQEIWSNIELNDQYQDRPSTHKTLARKENV